MAKTSKEKTTSSPKLNLYNKFRPHSFSEVTGQEHVCRVLESQIAEGTLPHCMIFYGPPGVGKTSVARLVAEALNPSKHGVIEKDSSSEGGKDSILNLHVDAYNKPFEGELKTYIFDEAHEITNSAFNSLLKITEEPPPHVKFIFVTSEFGKIPDSIKSRSKSHYFSRLSNQLIRSRIEEIVKAEGVTLDSTLISLAVQAGGGSLRNAIVALETIITLASSKATEEEIAESLGIVRIGKLVEFIGAYIKFDFRKLNELTSLFNQEKTDSLRVISDLQQLLMDARISLILPDMQQSVKSETEPLLTFIESQYGKLKDESQLLEFKRQVGQKLDTMYDLSLQLEQEFKRTSTKEPLVTRFVVKLAQSLK